MTTKKVNRGGRPRGARNKLNAQDEIKKALNRGTGLVELKQFLWDMMQDEKVTDTQKCKVIDKYWELIKFIHQENLKIEEQPLPKKEESKDIQKGEHTEQPKQESAGVVQMKFGKK